MRRPTLAAILCAAALPATAQDEDACGASGFQGLVGQSGEVARMLELDQPVRVIPPNTPVTMDYRPERINFELDEAGVIMRVRCG